MLFTGAKVTHLSRLPQGQPGRYNRVQDMVEQMDAEGFGGCSNFGECEAVCPAEISIRVIGHTYRDYLVGVLYHPRNPRGAMKPQ
jgi:succinate dehydrogenase / fumarate reductase iron-sulfur subunit